MQKTILIIVLATLCLNFSNKLTATAQFYKPSDKTIRIGEILPESFYQTVHQAITTGTGTSTTLKLQQYRNKLIILDFWATWCKPCIYSLNKLDSIKKAMNNDDFIVIPVTYQGIKEITPTLNKFKWDMASIVSDTLLARIFPHDGIPHQVWIRNGKVLTIPKASEATAENITQTLKGKMPSLRLNIQDNAINPLIPLFTKGNGETGLFYKGKYSSIGRHIPNYGAGGLKFLNQRDTSILYSYNISISQLLFEAFQKDIFPGFSSNQGLVWNVSDQLMNQFVKRPVLNQNPAALSARSNWIIKNSYGYNLRYPKFINKNEALKIMQKDLNLFFGVYLNIKASIEDGPKEKYLVLRLKGNKSESEHLLKSKHTDSKISVQGDYYHYENMLFGQQFLARLSLFKLVSGLTTNHIIDSTGIATDFKVDFDFSKATNGNLNVAQKELSRYNLYLTVEDKQVPVLVIREKG